MNLIEFKIQVLASNTKMGNVVGKKLKGMLWLTRDGAHHPYSTKALIECTYTNLRIPSLKLFIKKNQTLFRL
jgi:hypothetical protein